MLIGSGVLSLPTSSASELLTPQVITIQGLRPAVAASSNPGPPGSYRILLPQGQQLLVSRLQPAPVATASPQKSTAVVTVASSAAGPPAAPPQPASSSAAAPSPELVSRMQAFPFPSFIFSPAPPNGASGQRTQQQLMPPSSGPAATNTSFLSCQLSNTVTSKASVLLHPAAASTVGHGSGSTSAVLPPLQADSVASWLLQHQRVLRYHHLEPVDSSCLTSLQVISSSATPTSPVQAGRLNPQLPPGLQLLAPGVQISGGTSLPAVSGGPQLMIQQIGAACLIPSPSSDLPSNVLSSPPPPKHQQVILQRLSLAGHSAAGRPRQPTVNVSVRPLTFPPGTGSAALAAGGGIKTVMRTTLVPRPSPSSYSEAQINSILQQMVPEPPRVIAADTFVSAGEERDKPLGVAPSAGSNLEARHELVLQPVVTSSLHHISQQPPTSEISTCPSVAPTQPPPPAAQCSTSSCPPLLNINYDPQNSPMIQPLEILPDSDLEHLVEEENEESLENVVIPVIPEHLGEVQLRTGKVGYPHGCPPPLPGI